MTESKSTPLEGLLVSAACPDLYPILVLNPFTWTDSWRFPIKDLQGNISGIAEPLGRNPSRMIVTAANKSLLFCFSLAKNGSSCIRSIMPDTIKCLVSHPSGSFIFGAALNKIYAWMINTGDLCGTVEDNFQHITALRISSCGSYLVSGAADGTAKLYLTSEIIHRRHNEVEAIRATCTWSCHSLPIKDIFITGGRSSRVLTVSLDHTAILYSISAKQVILKVSVDHALSSCCIDPAETRLFLGSTIGKLCILDLCSGYKSDELTVIALNLPKPSSGITVLDHSTEEICKICVNFDGTRLASGSADGCYKIWDISNGQCLKSSTMKGNITTLKFVEWWTVLKEQKGSKQALLPLPPLKLSAQNLKTRAFKQTEANSVIMGENEELFRISIDYLLSKNCEEKLKVATDSLSTFIPVGKKPKLDSIITSADIAKESHTSAINDLNADSAGKMRELEAEIARVKKINAELYAFASEILVGEIEER
ncbi:pre-rRNA-processing protein pro-1 [Ditylenchus destructor]|uniref:Pre-rRNA-processing protein pro-1 n=1 Tax=Ditylenchus destructor TaxID=166010 RepID=A0AAD4NAU2_9BILA|nr:pre-rRNA-processing protein pro-1 [Ditylenchus destructor]